MKSTYLLVIGGVVIAVLVGILLLAPSKKSSEDSMQQDNVSDNKVENTEMPDNDAINSEADSNRYVDYSSDYLSKYPNVKKVLFFHAPWCPTCKVAHTAFTENENMIPKDVILIKTDYDTSTELKKQYGIGYQHTFVYIDDNGNEIKKWNGGDIDQLIKMTSN